VTREALRLTSYFGERRRRERGFIADALLDLYLGQQITTSITLRGSQGFGQTHHLRTDHSLTLSEDLPLVTMAVDARPQIEVVLDEAIATTSPGLLTLQRLILLGDDAHLSTMPAGLEAEEVRLTVHLGRHERAHQIPAFEAICDLLYRHCISGATALLGVDGASRGRRQRSRFFGRDGEAPMMVVAVDSWEQIRRVLPDVSGLLRHPLLTLEPVRVCKRDGLFLGIPDRSSGTDEYGMERWQKLTVYTSEAAQHEGQPLHRALCQRLLAAGVSGVTTLRGVWGFHGERAPHGDNGLRLGRHVPAVTIVIDAPERITTAFTIIDELTADHGLVTSETISAKRAVPANLREE